MRIQDIVELFSGSESMKRVSTKLQSSAMSKLGIVGLAGSADALMAAVLYAQNARTQLHVFADEEDAKYFAADLESILDSKQILFFPSSFRRTYSPDTVDSQRILNRAEVLNRLNKQQSQSELIITTFDALSERVISGNELVKNTYEVKQGDRLDPEFFIEFLNEHAFVRSDFVYEAGQFSLRGGIIDVFSFSNDMPYRIELDGDIVESIRVFDPESQLSVKKVVRFFIIPNVQSEHHSEERQQFFDYLPNDTLVVGNELPLAFDLFEKGMDKAGAALLRIREGIDISNPDIVEPYKNQTIETVFMNAEQIRQRLTSFSVLELGQRRIFKSDADIEFQCVPQPSFHKNFPLIIENLHQLTQSKIQTYIFSDSSRQIERLYAIFEDLDKTVHFQPVYHALSHGFIDRNIGIACYTEHQLFDRFYKGKSKNRSSSSKIITLKELQNLKPGDFVVHMDHGIGRFAGLEKIDMNGHKQEAVRLIYRNDDLLYVSINSLHKITRYTGKDGTEPRLHKLGSDTWEKLKTSTKKKVKDIARDLIRLYAKRKAQKGFAFQPDNYLQMELEASFMYEDTPDQLKASLDVKKDMETPHPMDRLVCGDVGFGKTEVAIRSAFKAVCDSKQVAVLVPTTILANQHYRTFKERLKDLPCNVDYINRFKPASEQKKILEKLKEGKIDILIGTHKLLSKEIKFKDLGLLIIDEEQKFGVAAKEKLKSMRVNVDTLTLTATPIPRTLHFSLMGARDLSVINTPPPNRQPVTTELHNFNDELIKEAIQREVGRGGQVFFIHHRVKDIYEYANRIERICPGVKAAVAHGQLEGDTLEDIMVKFIEGEYDVLVATSIIESGLDISNANTIIINNAHMFGLSDLHQMRGRVGRSNKKAFCYLLVPAMSSLSVDGRRRLQAIEEFNELGSGFNVAMRDLDIRGAGNLLGGEQSGFIAEIGFEMYNKILDEAIRELKEDEFRDVFADERPSKEAMQNLNAGRDCQVESDFEALIPDAYVRNIGERLALYKQLSSLTQENEFIRFESELIDRFGALPQEVLDLTDMIRVRESARKLGFEKIVLKNKSILASFPNERNALYYQSELFSAILQFVNRNPMICRLKQKPNVLQLAVTGIHDTAQAKNFLQGLNDFVMKSAEAVR